MRDRLRRTLGFAAVAIVLCVGVLAVRAVWEGRQALAAGDAAAARGDTAAALVGWRRAARWYVPLAPHVDIAYDRLEHAARAAEAAGDQATAVASWRGVLGSVNATRGLWAPQAARRDRARARLAELLAEPPPGQRAVAIAGDPVAHHRAQLERSPGPRLAWVVVALVGLAAWIGGVILLATRGLGDADVLIRRPAAAAAALVAVGVVVWALGLSQA